MPCLINMRNISQEKMYVLILFDRFSDRGLNLLNVVADESPVDRDSGAAVVLGSLNLNHF